MLRNRFLDIIFCLIIFRIIYNRFKTNSFSCYIFKFCSTML